MVVNLIRLERVIRKATPIDEENICYQRNKAVQASPPPYSCTHGDGLRTALPSKSSVLGPKMRIALVTCSGQMGAFLVETVYARHLFELGVTKVSYARLYSPT